MGPRGATLVATYRMETMMTDLSPERMQRAMDLLGSFPEPEGTLEDVIARADDEIADRFRSERDELAAEPPIDLAAGVNAKEGASFLSALGADAAPPEAKSGPHARLPPLRHPGFDQAVGGCWNCGRPWGPGWVDCWIPDEYWQRIAPNPNGQVDYSGYLCVHCVVLRLELIGASDVPVAVSGRPIKAQPMVPGAQVELRGDGRGEESQVERAVMDTFIEYGDDIHSWRCAYPDVYGACSCREEFAADVAARLSATNG